MADSDFDEQDDLVEADKFISSASLGLTIFEALRDEDVNTMEALQSSYTGQEQYEAILDALTITLDTLALATHHTNPELIVGLRESLLRIRGEV